MHRLDAVLGRVTMYRLVLLVLLAIAVAAEIAAVVGAIAFDPLALPVTALLAVGVVVAVTRLLALVVRIRPHTESSLITGLLVFLLFLPVLDAPDLVALVAAAAFAAASKVLLAWRGRHVFNPVAIGAVLVTVLHLGGATWWVATPALLPLILVGGALVVLRTRTPEVALPVAAIPVAGTTALLAGLGTPLLPAAGSAIASYPYLFLAAFMATEPLTLPPRRWQRLLVGVIVGVVALVPLHVAYIAMAPEIALVVGNAVAFAFGPRRRVRLVLHDRRTVTGGIGDLVFRAEHPLHLRAGQYVELSLPHRRQDGRGARRMFSPANRPGTDEVRVVTRWATKGSSFKRSLAALEPGAVVAGSAVGGDFVLPRSAAVPLLWIAGGIGITPFASFADDLGARGEDRDVVLVHVASTPGDLLLAPAFTGAGVRALVVGPPRLQESLPPGWTLVADRLDRLDLASLVPDAARRTAYLAGSPGVVAAARRLARSAGVHRIRTDRFLGY
ncbi:FAD-dependent oxidoreductase [Amnibacterium sp. CER49]|uniref:FAD-dependent oxidoreductase n=1 Tax=Amnibacterium sp. CER49 TaxID=3039161 RepID=UPI00244C9B2B|nr:FAD-dependent oxidoreductase [Amnibacterium sp. CER49]MDH2444234.1 FAD-dependent oxidoreductase [Amnibacterium sp. CER49]